jgi:predicted nucleic acid-binding protein
MDVLIDTSFLFAVLYQHDTNHQLARNAMLGKLKQAQKRIVLEPVLHELFLLSSGRLGYLRAIETVSVVENSVFTIEPLLPEDRQRLIDILTQYQSAKLDYADAAIMAVSERLNIKQIYTFDRRDFSIFRPRHSDYLELLPQK